jgi:hypothetical protein
MRLPYRKAAGIIVKECSKNIDELTVTSSRLLNCVGCNRFGR